MGLSFSTLGYSLLFATAAAGLVCSAFAAAPAPQAAATSGYHEIARYPVGGDGGWDYLACDSVGHRLFITRGSHVMVVSTDTGKVLGDIPNTKGCHGIAFAPDLNRGFISDGGDNTVTVFDLKTLGVLQTVPVGQNPDSILYDATTRRVLTFNGRSHDATALDAATGKVVGTIALGGKPEFAISDNETKHVFVNIEDKSELVTLDPKALTVLARTSLAPGEEPSGLAFDAKRHLLFAACGNEHAAVVDSRTGKLLATPTIGSGPDAAVVDSSKGLAFTSNGDDGTLSVIKQEKAGAFVVESVPTKKGARTMTIDPKTHRLYLVTADYAPADPNAKTTSGRPARPRPVPGSFTILVYGQ